VARPKARPKRRERKNVEHGIAHIRSTFNNTIITITEYGVVKLFVNANKPPFIYLQSNGKIAIFNLADAQKTEEAYEEILRKTR
jgi:phage terminase large subunit